MLFIAWTMRSNHINRNSPCGYFGNTFDTAGFKVFQKSLPYNVWARMCSTGGYTKDGHEYWKLDSKIMMPMRSQISKACMIVSILEQRPFIFVFVCVFFFPKKKGTYYQRGNSLMLSLWTKQSINQTDKQRKNPGSHTKPSPLHFLT